MRNLFFGLLLILSSLVSAQKISNNKKAIIQSIEKHNKELIAISDSIWGLAETAFNETQSSVILSNYAEKNGFAVERGVSGMPTAFIATYGSGKPVVG